MGAAGSSPAAPINTINIGTCEDGQDAEKNCEFADFSVDDSKALAKNRASVEGSGDRPLANVAVFIRATDRLLEDFVIVNSLRAGPRTVKHNKRCVAIFLQAQNIEDVEQITLHAITCWLAACKRSGLSMSTLHNYKHALSAFCSYLVDDRELLYVNPCKKVKLPKAEKAPHPILRTEDMKKALASAFKHGCYGEVATAMLAALRQSELARLLWTDIEFKERVLTVRKSKSKKPRIVPMCRQLIVALRYQRRRLERAGGFHYVFPARKTYNNGSKWVDKQRCVNSWKNTLEPVRQECFRMSALPPGCSVGRGWHLLRHSCLTEMARTTGDKWFVQQIAGHSDIKVTEGYLHLAQGYDKRIEGLLR